jgi:DNA polymerase III epsilon subunit-like protein
MYKDSKAVKLLSTKDIRYVITTPDHHVGVYSNNTAIVAQRTEELPLVLIKTKKGWNENNDSELFNTVAGRLGELDARMSDVEVLSKDEVLTLNLDQWLPKSKIYKRGATISSDYATASLFSFKWEGRDWTLLVAVPTENILDFITTSFYDTTSITYVDHVFLPDQLNIIEQWLNAYHDENVVAVDNEKFDPLEPGGWRALSHRHGTVRSVQLWCPSASKGLFIDFGPRGMNMYSGEVSKRLTNFFKQKYVVFHNALFDLAMLEAQLGISLAESCIIDTQVLSQNLWAGLRIMPHNLGALAKRFGLEINKDLQTSDFGVPLIPAQIQYGMDDTRITAEVMRIAFIKLQENGGNIGSAKIDCGFIHALHTMRMKGFPVDVEALNQAIKTMEDWLEAKAEEFTEFTGVKYTEREKVLEALQRLYPNAHISSTNKTEMASKGHLPAVQLLTDCKFAGIRLAYAYAVRDALTPQGTACGGFRPLANQGMGRTACTAKVGGKNGVFVQLQNPAKADKRYPELPDLRTVFGGGINEKRQVKRKLVILDLSAAHLRLSHDFSDEMDQIKLCNTPDSDSHSYNGAIVVRTALMDDERYRDLNTYEKFLAAKNAGSKDAKKVRDLSKNAIYTKINFGSAWSLQATIQKFGTDIDIETCELAMEGIGEAIPKWIAHCNKALKETNTFDYDFSHLYKSVEDIRQSFIDDGVDDPEELDALVAEVTKKRPSSFGYLICPTGRGRYVPKFTREGRYGKYESAKLPDCSAFVLQASEADIMKIAGTRFNEWARTAFRDKSVDCWLAVIAHDEFVIVCDEDYAERAGRKMHSLMEEEARKVAPRVPLLEPWTNDGYIKDNWSEK